MIRHVEDGHEEAAVAIRARIEPETAAAYQSSGRAKLVEPRKGEQGCGVLRFGSLLPRMPCHLVLRL